MNRHQFCNDKTLLVSYLYGECDDAERRRAFEEHLTECADCAAEVAELRDLRSSLSEWEAPERALGFRIVSEPPQLAAEVAGSPTTSVASRRRWTPPWWLQTAAAVLLFAMAAGVAQVEVRYGPDGLVVRTGWSKPAAPASSTQSVNAQAQAPWRQELAALEQELRQELSSVTTRAPAGVPRGAQTLNDRAEAAPGINEATLLGRVQALIEQSELKQQRELAVRLAGVVRDVDIQRRADQMRVQQTFGQLEGQTGVAVQQNRELLNYLVRVSQQR